MIIDSIENFGRYANLHPNFAKAVRFLEQNDPFSLPDGKTIVDGENVFINVGDNFISQHETSWECQVRRCAAYSAGKRAVLLER
jgi:beta-galactosidase beta subunit